MIQAIFFDIDGTLVCHEQGCVPERARRALGILKANGIHRVIATGRHLSELPGLPLEGLDFDGYITLNGQLCYDRSKKLLYGDPITGTQKQTILSVFNQRRIPLMLIEEDRMYINFLNDRVLEAQHSVNAQIPDISDYSGSTVYQAVAFVDPQEKQALEELLPGCRLTYWTKWAVDVVPTTAGKTVGIRQYLALNGLSPAQAMAFGDGENDQDMLMFAGTGVAMGNAPAHVKACADFVTDPPGQDGIYHALKHFDLI